jgi:DNA-binding MarR family transcriptional regulator
MSPSRIHAQPSPRSAHGSWMTHVHPHDLLADTLRREMPDIDDAGVELTRRVMRLAGILHDRLTVHSARWNLTKGEVNVLATLRSVGSPFELRPTDLQARLLLSSGGISNVLNRLERNGLVERQRESNDGRSCWVRLTGEGAELAYAFARSWTEAQIDTDRAVSPAALRLASDSLREVLLALGDDEPLLREDRISP